MNYICFKGKEVIGITDRFPFTSTQGVFTDAVPVGTTSVKTKNDFHTFAEVQAIADQLSKVTGDQYIATDTGGWAHPRYDVARIPAVGEIVSMVNNGRIRPDGPVIKVTKTFQIKTEKSTYQRVGKSGVWKHADAWSLMLSKKE